MEKLIAFAVNIGNLGRTGRPRFVMAEWVHGLNATLRAQSEGLRVLDFFGHTGNFAIASDLAPDSAGARLASLLHTACAIVGIETVKQCAEAARTIAPPPTEAGSRWTPGAVFAVAASSSFGELPTSPSAVFQSHSSGTILAGKRDQLDGRGRLDKTRRAGGWGAVSSKIARHLGGIWTARSISTLDGIVERAEAPDTV
jgi:hypothetical protein